MNNNEELRLVGALIKDINTKINSIEELGYNVSDFYKVRLNGIKDNYKSLLNSSDKSLASYNISLLEGLLEELNTYDNYVIVKNSVNYLNTKIQNINITSEELSEVVSEAIRDIKLINKTIPINNEVEKKIIFDLYETVYKIIELELLLTSNSQLYLYIIQDRLSIPYLNELIKDKIDNIEDKSELLKEKVFEIKKNGINSNYANLELISVLMHYQNNFDYEELMLKRISKDKSEFNKRRKDIRDLTSIVSELDDDIYHRFSDKKYALKTMKNSIASLVLTLSFLSGSALFLPKAFKRWSTEQSYIKTTEIYTTIDDEDTILDEKVVFYEKPNKSAIIKEYDKYWTKNKRRYISYDASELEFDTAKEYYDYYVENVNNKYAEVKTANKFWNDEDFSDYEDEYTIVELVNYKDNGKVFYKTQYDGLITLLILVDALLVIFTEAHELIGEDCPFIISKICQIIDSIKSYKKNSKSEEEFKLELKERLLELKELLDKNEVLKNEFDKLCEQYKAYNFDFNDWNNEYFNISDDKHYDMDNDKDFALEMTNRYKIK